MHSLREKHEKEMEELTEKCRSLEQRNDDLQFELKGYEMPEAPNIDFSRLNHNQLSKMFGTQDKMVLSKASNFMSHIVTSGKDIGQFTKEIEQSEHLSAENVVLQQENGSLSFASDGLLPSSRAQPLYFIQTNWKRI